MRADNDSEEDNKEEMMQWSKIKVDDAVLALWPGTLVRQADLKGDKSIIDFFHKVFDIEIIPVGCVTTLPDVDHSGLTIEHTGGRHDFFFFVKTDDMLKFARKRFKFQMRWWSDVYFNNDEHIYPLKFLKAYP